MPGGARYGDRRQSSARPVRSSIGLGKSQLARMVDLSPSRISQLCKDGRLKTESDGSVNKDSAYDYFAAELVDIDSLVPDEVKAKADEVRNTTREKVQESINRAKLQGAMDKGVVSADMLDIEKARARQVWMQSEKMRIEVEKMTGTLIDRGIATNTLIEAFLLTVQALRQLESRLPDEVQGISNTRIIREKVRAEVEPMIERLRQSMLEMVDEDDAGLELMEA